MLFLVPVTAFGDVVLSVRTVRSRAILTVEDVVVKKTEGQGAFSRVSEVVGLEARVVLYAGRPISAGDVGPAAIIERNQIVRLVYARGPLSIVVDARSLGRAGIGDRLRVMNLSSRNTVTGTVEPNGYVTVRDPSFAIIN